MFDELSKTELAPDVLIDKIYTSLSELSLTYVHQAAKYTSLANKFSNEEGLSAPTTTLRQIDLGEETSQLRLFTAGGRQASWRFYNWREREGAERHKSVANCAQRRHTATVKRAKKGVDIACHAKLQVHPCTLLKLAS